MARDTKPVMLLRTRGDRLLYAIKQEGTSLQKVEAAVGFSKGFLSRYSRDERGGTLIDVDKMQATADLLHVQLEWLLVGTGPIRRGGRDTTPAEEALVLCRRSGCREEAIQAAWERFRDRESTMTAAEWVSVIQAEDALLARQRAERVERMEVTVPPPTVDAPRLLGPGDPRKPTTPPK